jgi:ABC-2 type transport system ATP-binding protein
LGVILKVDTIFKRFGDITAVNNISFTVQKGEIFALLGPNGSGKTTTVRMLMDIIKPDEGRIEFFSDHSNSTTALHTNQFGYLPEERGLYPDIPIIKTLEYMGIIKGMKKADAKKSAEEWLDKLELLDRKKEKLNTLSKGNQQKVQFISSVIHNPSFAILDEPFAGFDPINQEAFLAIIKDLRDKGTTVLLSAHQMQLVEKIGDKIMLLNNGKCIANGTIDDLKSRSKAGEKLIIYYEGQADFSFLKNDEAVEKFDDSKNGEITIILRQNKSLSGLLGKVSSNLKITSVKTEHTTLHDIYIEMVNKDKEVNDAD